MEEKKQFWRKGNTVTDRTKSQKNEEGAFKDLNATGRGWP